MASVFLSSPAEVVVVDSRTRAGTITLPTTNSIPFRVLNFKDQYGTFLNSTLTVSTQVGESFDDGMTSKTFNTAFSFLSLYCVSSKWMVMNATQTVQQTISSLTVNQLTFGTGAGWVQFGPVQATVISSIQVNTNDAYINNVFVGQQSTLNDIMFFGLQGNYNNTVIAEMSTGAGTQELLFFKGSTTSDRVRVQTTGSFVVETGVSARLFNQNATTTLSNITPAFLINTSSNVGIQTASPGATLDVAGTARAIILSSQMLNVSSINSLNLQSPLGTVSSLLVNSLQFGDGTGWISLGPIQNTAVSTIQGNANTQTTIVTSTLAFNVSSINGTQFPSNYVSQGLLFNDEAITQYAEIPVPFVSDFDPNGWLLDAGTSSARVIPTIPGYYSVTFQVWWAATPNGGGQTNIQVRKNNDGIAIAQSQLTNSFYGFTQITTKLCYMNGLNDVLQFFVYTETNDSSQNIQYGTPGGAGTFYSLNLIR